LFALQDIRKRINAIPPLGKLAQFVAIPTTSGTGSEVTPFAVVTDQATGIKYPLADYALVSAVTRCRARGSCSTHCWANSSFTQVAQDLVLANDCVGSQQHTTDSNACKHYHCELAVLKPTAALFFFAADTQHGHL
jgi:hypothetical protein